MDIWNGQFLYGDAKDYRKEEILACFNRYELGMLSFILNNRCNEHDFSNILGRLLGGFLYPNGASLLVFVITL